MGEVQIRTWETLTKDEFFEIARLRCEVFYVEQRVDVQDFDDADRAPDTEHYFIRDEHGVAAYLRVLSLPTPEYGAHRALGRVAVRRERRGEGLGKRLMAPAVQRWGHEPIVLHSQEYIVGLYAGFGFEIVGEPYVEAGIPHRSMLRPADADPEVPADLA